MKQRGALLAKGRFFGAQFLRFFEADDLWLRIGGQANAAAARLADGLSRVGVELVRPRQINQVFAVLPEAATPAC